ncbi:MAG: hypothetical protein D6730_20555, partial [Bacteroidetes bacterium]
ATYSGGTLRGSLFHEVDLDNPEKSGRYWLGEGFSGIVNQRTFSFYLPDAAPGASIKMRLRVAADAPRSTSFRILAGGELLGTLSITGIQNNATAAAYLAKTRTYTFSASLLQGDSLQVVLDYNAAGAADARGWLDWIEIDYPKQLLPGLPYLEFSTTDQRGASEVGQYAIPDAGYRLWEVTNPLQVVECSLSNQMLYVPADTIRHFVAFKDGFRTPVSGLQVRNQNLHGLDLADYLIISYPAFRAEAERLADFHRSHYGRVVHVVTPQEIYNEFSSGKQDVTAIRDFVKMFYDQSAGQLPGFVLLFGDGTYDIKGIVKDPVTNETLGGNFIPTYQSRNSWSPVNSYTSDDFFVLLDDEEGFWGENARMTGDSYVLDNDNRVEVNKLDAAVGRLPVENLEQARIIVDKIIDYATNPEGFGTWRNKVVLVADHLQRDHSTHVSQADSYTGVILGNNPCINLEKIYMDNYPAESTPSGVKFPEGKKALLSALDEGSLIVNYTGHGGATAWSNADILLLNDINNVHNPHRLPAYVTATCSFGHYDDPGTRSGAETLLMMEGNRGSIAMLTTVRLVYSSPNATLNANLYRQIFTFDEDKGRMPTIGEVMMHTKNATFPRGSTTNINSRNFTLLGDPGLILNYPGLKARVTAINGQGVDPARIDTLRSLSKVLIEGEIEDPFGNRVDSYEGEIAITIYDKPSKFTTRLSPFTFSWQKNRIFNGTATVANGHFQFSFVVPIDISYDDGFGKISLYFSGEGGDGGGCYSNMYIGGTELAVAPDRRGPDISLFINDTNWVDGGITDANPWLYALLSDSSGINTVGSAIGHEIIGVLDGDETRAFILNEYYTARKDSYTDGEVRFQMENLAEGKHELMLRVWDGANNPTEARTTFWVVSNEQMVLDQIKAVPNPFHTHTEFRIGHNQANQQLRATVRVINLAGQVVRQIQTELVPAGNLLRLDWDGKRDDGRPLNNGMYVYQVLLENLENGQQAVAVERLVLLR